MNNKYKITKYKNTKIQKYKKDTKYTQKKFYQLTDCALFHPLL